MLGPFFVETEVLEFEDKAVSKLKDNAGEVLRAGIEVIEGLPEFTVESLEEGLRARLIDEMQVKPRLAFGPLRTAISGRQVSPPLFESMEIMGKDEVLARLRQLEAKLSA